MQDKFSEANATRKNLAGELMLQPKSLYHKYRAAASQRWRLWTGCADGPARRQIRKCSCQNTDDWVSYPWTASCNKFSLHCNTSQDKVFITS